MLYPDHRLKLLLLMIWIIVILFNKTDSTENNDISQPDPLIAADVGDNVTLRCFTLENDISGYIIWYQQKIGHEPRIIVAVQHESSYENEFKPPKFNINKEKRKYHLKIAHVEPSDEAMYYCGYRKFLTRFGNGTFLAVRGNEDVNVTVRQHRVLDPVPAGASVTLQCSVLSESRAAELQVLWFRAAAPQSHPQIIYTHHNSSHQCESGSSTHTCVYNFTKNILSLSDTGTYYCAVALCGKIVFGNGTQVQLVRSPDPAVIFLTVALAVSVVVIFALIVALNRKRSTGEQHSARLKQGSVTDKTRNQDRDKEELNYAALHFNERRTERGRVKKQPQHIIYSDVRGLSIT
ncbi:hypothetical protein KOW79_007024 [Hemibagrus wyckioides]|uniref:Ig-like domain-containing protein n=1 Tax=Hemibagrus wyckioides TaxID=337641 RepID=A0A9D3SMJ9_9TELE|nr:uncharacterized protein LOC131357737 [Hemibagrus wyckioides]KAG7328850.1 hypothetical protein KOW79_007024 [Hemibagrus wyckioides]